jgi:putative endonuclease
MGVTNNVIRQIAEHKQEVMRGFTKKYSVKILVYYEHFASIVAALDREKVIKKWKRCYKIRIIESINPQWKDLYYDLS